MSTLQILSTLIAIAAIFGWVSTRWLKLPLTIGSVLLTVLFSLLLEAISAQVPGLHSWAIHLVNQINFETLILHGMLPMLLFAGAFLLDLQYVVQERLVIALLSVVGTILSTGAVAGLMWVALFALGMHPHWLACFFFGALISPTDPIAVLEMLKRVGAPKHLQAQLAGESLFNDGIGAVIFLTLLGASRGVTPTALSIGWVLLLEIGGGVLLGVLCARLTSFLMEMVDSYQVEILLTLSLALGGYGLAETLHLSAPLEAVVAGIALRHFNLRRTAHIVSHGSSHVIAHESIDRFWEVIDEIQNAVLFVLLGLEVLSISFASHVIASGFIAIVVVLAVRLGVVALVLGIIRAFRQQHRSSLAALSWGGLRGGLGLALAFAVPVSDANRWILPTTYIVVVFSIIVQGWSMDLFLRKFRQVPSPALAPQ
ncbi:MAG TPA: sodium:proton antiporter [Acidobacteriaceae bacterium]